MENIKKPRIPLVKRVFRELKINAFAYIIVSLAFIHFAIFKAIPFISSLLLSFFNYNFFGGSKFIGLNNWVDMFKDAVMWKSLWNTTLFTLYYVIPTMIIGLLLAVLINVKMKGTGAFRVIYFLPVVTAFTVIASIWKWIFTSRDDGLVNTFLAHIGLPTQNFFNNGILALLILAGLSIYKISGSTMLYYFGGLKQIPESLYEAASIDGASPAKQFFTITVPMLRPTTFYVAIMTTISSFQVFDSAYLLTSGGPNYATTTIVYYIYQKAFVAMDFGYASTLSFILFFIILAISFLQNKVLGDEA